MDRQPTSSVSVDAITLRYNTETRHVEVGVSKRIIEPYIDQLALPGVTLWEGERLAEATERAVRAQLFLAYSWVAGFSTHSSNAMAMVEPRLA